VTSQVDAYFQKESFPLWKTGQLTEQESKLLSLGSMAFKSWSFMFWFLLLYTLFCQPPNDTTKVGSL